MDQKYNDAFEKACEMTNERLVMFTRMGSHFAGTADESCNHNYRGIYLPTINELIKGVEVPEIIIERSRPEGQQLKGSEDWDIRLCAIQSFLGFTNFSTSLEINLDHMELLYAIGRQSYPMYKTPIANILYDHRKQLAPTPKRFLTTAKSLSKIIKSLIERRLTQAPHRKKDPADLLYRAAVMAFVCENIIKRDLYHGFTSDQSAVILAFRRLKVTRVTMSDLNDFNIILELLQSSYDLKHSDNKYEFDTELAEQILRAAYSSISGNLRRL